MPSLMDIPRELRDKICAEVLLTPSTPPNLAEPFDLLIESRVRYQKPKLRAWSTEVLYDPQNPTNTIFSLLLVNRQLYHETLSTMRHLSKAPVCEMDLIIVDEVVLLPTWLLVPPQQTTAFDTVNVTFRIAGAFNKEKDYPLKGFYWSFRGGDGGGPAMGWQLYAVLERFLSAGVGGETKNADTGLHITAKRICIDVQTPAGIEEERFALPRTGHHRRRDVEKGVVNYYVLDPKYLANFVNGHLDGLLRPNCREWFQYGQILFEHVDEVVVCKDGVEVAKWDVAECLEGREINDRYFSAEDMRKYKLKAWELRKSRGLKVPERYRMSRAELITPD
ncbi:hypothetical protein E8E13_005443 [Curvularia kusanoi]|uniref:Uncharacterized protein n=1 Tax=Curvularia kusanoi TaxID=90978 RepID=A0A9P4WEP5_CURKU|nr:hypothetical protein E8E13_005443 [Curvularia kusanoi]